MEFKTIITLDGKKLFTINSSEEGKLMWECYGSTTKEEHSKALLELLRIGYEIGKLKVELDSKRINDSDDPIIFG